MMVKKATAKTAAVNFDVERRFILMAPQVFDW
jgi:hypothetical protein